ncbi:MAG: protein kinase [Methylococcales bacterium]
MNQDIYSEFCFKSNYQLENQLLNAIRQALISDRPINIPESLALPFDPALSQIYISLFQRGLKPLRWGSRKATLPKTVARVVEKLKVAPRFNEFAVADQQQCRLLFEMVVEEKPCSIRNLTGMAFTQNRFEPGITGFKYIYQGVVRYFMPTDAVVHSIMSVPQLLQFLAKQTGIAKQTKRFSEREQLMRHEPIDYRFIQSIAFISFVEETLPLYRGYPMPVQFNKAILLESTLKSIDWLLNNMNADGSFLYFYDGYLDTKVDFDHPNMLDPLYNNILRHGGGTITLLRGYELTDEQRYLEAARHSLQFLLSTLREHEVDGHYACYPFDNKKSKLGGAGIGLVALMHYYRHTQDENYRRTIDGFVRHILSRIDAEGEMIGYYIHPLFNNGEPLIDPPDNIKQQLFSFYYPGEALLGLALYFQWINAIKADLKAEIYDKSLLALDFLVAVRPIKYQALFLSLPADAWLMQAIEAWVKVDGFKKQAYLDFVFNDARAMIEHAYQESDAPYVDYLGGFYYNYGDHVYHDASRCEGLIAAYYLADYLGDAAQAESVMAQMLKSAKGLMYTRHTPESTYAHKYPEKSINSFRFKLTRQWVRVDSVQHAACFFARLLPLLNEPPVLPHASGLVRDKIPVPDSELDFEIIKLISSSGFSKVYKARDKVDAQKFYAIKIFKDTRFEGFIQAEVKILQEINQYPAAVPFYGQGKINNTMYLRFKYVDTPNLQKMIRSQGAFGEGQAIKVLQDILSILKFSHARGILHLDVKPENILLYDQQFTLIDWGLAKKSLYVETVHRKGDAIYLAPELYSGYRNCASEIYSLGCVLLYVLTGKAVYNLRHSDDLATKIFAHFYLQAIIPETLPFQLRYLLMRILDKNPQTRASITEIEHILASGEVHRLPESDLPTLFEQVDKTDAVALYSHMAHKGIAFAQVQLGRLLEQGKQVQVNLQQAVYWYAQAAAQGFSAGQCYLGLAYRNGLNGVVDYKKAFYYLRLAADREYAEAQYYLGEFYELGLSTDIDRPTAIAWYRRAAYNADKKAYRALKRFRETVELRI